MSCRAETIRPMFPVFIGGTGRSGTTILRQMLRRHSRIVAIRCELRFLIDPGGALDLVRSLSDRWTPYDADAAIHRFRLILRRAGKSSSGLRFFWHRAWAAVWRNLGCSPVAYASLPLSMCFGPSNYARCVREFFDGIVSHADPGHWLGSPSLKPGCRMYVAGPFDRHEIQQRIADFVHALYGGIMQDGQTHWVEDTPYNILRADELLTVFPAMKLIHLHRDPRDVVASYLTKVWGGTDVLTTAQTVADVYRQWFAVRERLPRECFLEVGLGDLVSDPDAGAERLCDFVGLDRQPVLTGLDSGKMHPGRWRRDLPSDALARVEELLGPYLDAYGYHR